MKTVSLLVVSMLMVWNLSAQNLVVDASKSTVNWTGKKVTGQHVGTINVKEGTLTVTKEKITAAKFVVDMNSIVCTDLTDAEWNGKLVGHLKSDDFFGVDKFATATLLITQSTPFVDNKASVSGVLTIKGIDKPIAFDVTRSGSTYTATIQVDRTKYDIKYGSGNFFEGLGDKTIDDIFTLDVKLAVK